MSLPAALPTLVRRQRASLKATLLAPPLALAAALILNLGLYVLMGGSARRSSPATRGPKRSAAT